jgi:hypothetical protein
MASGRRCSVRHHRSYQARRQPNTRCCSGWAVSIDCINGRKRLVPVQLKTLDCPVEKHDGSPLIGGDGQPVYMRCIREVALRESRGQVTWEIIEYAVGVPGFSFRPCASLDEARARFDAAPDAVKLPSLTP